MAQIINTNIASLKAQANLNTSQSALQTALQRLSSGLRINSAKDDAAGLAISDRMTSQIRGLNQAVRNANDGISLSQTAEGALGEVGNILQRMRELAIQSANATNSDSDRLSLQSEVTQLKQELTRISDTTSFNGQFVLNGSQQNIAFQVGAQANQTIGISIGDARSKAVGSNVVYASNTTNGMAKATSYNRFVTEGLAVGKAQTGYGALTDGLVMGQAQAIATAPPINGVKAQTLTLRDSSGTSLGTASVALSDDAKTIAASLNALAGVTATASTEATLLTATYANDNASVGGAVAFKINAQTLTLTGITAASTGAQVVAQLATQINADATLTNATNGISAAVNSAGNLVIKSSTGVDLKIELNAAAADSATLNVKGTDAAATTVTLASTTGAGNDSTTVSGRLSIALAQGNTIESGLGGTLAATGGIFNKAAAATATNVAGGSYGTQGNGYTAQTLTVRDAAGAIIEGGAVGVNANEQASDVAARLNKLQGVTATAYNQVKLANWVNSADTGSVTFTISSGGTSAALTLTGVTENSGQAAVFTALKNAIAGNASLQTAGVTAGLDSSNNLVIRNSNGADLGVQLTAGTSGTSGNQETVDVIGSDVSNTTKTIKSNGSAGWDSLLQTARVGGQLNVFLANGYTVESSKDGTSTGSTGGFLNVAASTSIAAKESNVGIADVLSGSDTANRFNGSGLVLGKAQTRAAAPPANGILAQTITIRDSSGTQVSGGAITVAAGGTIKTLIGNLNSVAGVTASGSNQITLSNFDNLTGVANDTLTFKINTTGSLSTGASLTLSGVDVTSSQDAIFTALASAVNQSSTLTGQGFSAARDASGNVVIKNTTGEDIQLEVNTSGGNFRLNVTGTDAASTAVTLQTGGATDSTTVSGQFTVAMASGYTIESSVSGTTAAGGGIFNAGAGTKATGAITSVNYGNSVAAQTLTVNGPSGQAAVAVQRDDSAETIAARINGVTSTTGVTASATTMAKLSSISAAGTVTFSLYGSNSSAVTISAAVTGYGSLADMSSLANAINAKSGSTGVRASLTDNKASITLSNDTGVNIVIADFMHSAGSAPTSSNIAGSDASISVTGLSSTVDANGAVTSVSTTTAKLHYGGVAASGADSTVVGGTLQFEANGAFDVKSSVSGSSVALVGGNSSLFANDAGITNASAFSNINGVDVSSVAGSNNAVSVIDSALTQVNSIRSTLGAIQNRFESAVSSLTAASNNVTSARSRIQDADFAAETAALTRGQILQQAGVAMLAQANALPNTVLALLK